MAGRVSLGFGQYGWAIHRALALFLCVPFGFVASVTGIVVDVVAALVRYSLVAGLVMRAGFPDNSALPITKIREFHAHPEYPDGTDKHPGG